MWDLLRNARRFDPSSGNLGYAIGTAISQFDSLLNGKGA